MTTQTSSPPSPSSPRGLLLLTHPRSASHLLLRVLNLPSQSCLDSRQLGGYYFFPTFLLQQGKPDLYLKPVSEWPEADAQALREMYQKCSDKLLSDSRAAVEAGKVPSTKEHTCMFLEPIAQGRYREGKDPFAATGSEEAKEPWTVQVSGPLQHDASTLTYSPLNTTPLPDAALLQWSPTFLVRHPALSFPSYKRVGNMSNAAQESQMTLKWTRALHEWYDAQFARIRPADLPSASDAQAHWPVIIHADDVITSPAVLRRWCALTGCLDVSKLQYEWSPLTQEQKEAMPKVARVMAATLHESQGIITEGKTAEGMGLLGEGKEKVLQEEARKWREEFGEEDGKVMERWVRGAIGDYEWLVERRLRA